MRVRIRVRIKLGQISDVTRLPPSSIRAGKRVKQLLHVQCSVSNLGIENGEVCKFFMWNFKIEVFC